MQKKREKAGSIASPSETIEVMKPDGRNLKVSVKGIFDEEGQAMESAPHPQQTLYVDLGTEVEVYDILRRREEAS